MSVGRERMGSRLGFLLLSAGCAIGLGNVWRFPYITGEYGGALFVCMYAACLLLLGGPLLIMEFAVGRAAQRNMGAAFQVLSPRGERWHRCGLISLVGSYLLMMFYTTVCGWMLYYSWATMSGQLSGLKPEEVGAFFGGLLVSPSANVGCLALTVLIGFSVCALGLRRGVEPVVKWMMAGLLLIMLALVGRAVTLPGAGEGLAFYLMPDMERLAGNGVWAALKAAMGQAFFTLGLGVGSMTIFGSYIGRERSLTGEALHIMGLDTFVALMAGLIIFPACFAFGVKADAGPGLVFVTLPNVFNSMGGGRFWGSLFFLFMSFAALSTVIAGVENIVSYSMDVWQWRRGKACLVNGLALFLLSLPCALGFNVWSGVEPLGKGTCFLDLWDFLLSYNMLPFGALVFSLFCCHRFGWGWENFLKEANAGSGAGLPSWLKPYMQYVLPLIVLLLFVQGYISKFF